MTPPSTDMISRDHLERSLARLDRLATLMDARFELPILRTRVGLDPIIGLLPGGGDWVTWCVSIYIFWAALRLGAPPLLLVRMAAHTGVDLVGGYVPIVGDLFDVAYKANIKNVALVRQHFGARPKLGSPLPATLPARVEHTGAMVAKRYTVGILLTVLLFALASVPFMVLYWLFAA